MVGIQAKAISQNTLNKDEDLVKVAQALSQVLADTFKSLFENA
jgi:hypothetical protein